MRLFKNVFSDDNNPIFTTIHKSINEYVNANKDGISDFHLMKDIVDRNCDAKEEEIQSQIPVPLYLGLVGTMVGILVGILYLWLSGGLRDLLTGGETGAEGVEALLGGVAIAMISSILGIVLTTIGSSIFRKTKHFLERNKHGFLCEIQTELLPTLSTDVSSSLILMSQNLQNFNNEFSRNTINFSNVVLSVNSASENVTRTLTLLQELDVQRIAKANIDVYGKLKNCTEEIGELAQYLNDVNQYLSNVRALNEKLDVYEKRTQFIEHASKFYAKHEKWLAENYDEANRTLQDVAGKYNAAIETTFSAIKSDLESKRQDLGSFLVTQNDALKSSAGDLDKIIKSLSELGEV
jgi:hypothetical protein